MPVCDPVSRAPTRLNVRRNHERSPKPIRDVFTEKYMSQTEQPLAPIESDGHPQVLRGGAGNVDKIRDILFGSQMRDYESRFARLEEALVKETAEIRETSRRRF